MKLNVLGIVLILLAHIAVALTVFAIVNKNETIPLEWVQNINQCTQYDPLKSMQFKCVSDCATIIIPFGILLVVLLTR